VRAGLPRDIDDVLTLALAKRIDDRYARASHLTRDLRSAAAGHLPDEVRRRAQETRASAAHRLPAGETLAATLREEPPATPEA